MGVSGDNGWMASVLTILVAVKFEADQLRVHGERCEIGETCEAPGREAS